MKEYILEVDVLGERTTLRTEAENGFEALCHFNYFLDFAEKQIVLRKKGEKNG